MGFLDLVHYPHPSPWYRHLPVRFLLSVLSFGGTHLDSRFTKAGKKVIVDGISWRLPLLGVLNAIYVNLWATQHFIVGA